MAVGKTHPCQPESAHWNSEQHADSKLQIPQQVPAFHCPPCYVLKHSNLHLGSIVEKRADPPLSDQETSAVEPIVVDQQVPPLEWNPIQYHDLTLGGVVSKGVAGRERGYDILPELRCRADRLSQHYWRWPPALASQNPFDLARAVVFQAAPPPSAEPCTDPSDSDSARCSANAMLRRALTVKEENDMYLNQYRAFRIHTSRRDLSLKSSDDPHAAVAAPMAGQILLCLHAQPNLMYKARDIPQPLSSAVQLPLVEPSLFSEIQALRPQ